MPTPNVHLVMVSDAAILFEGIAGTAIPAGCPVYQDGTTLNYLKAGAFISNAVQGISQCNAANGQDFIMVRSDPNFSHGVAGSDAGTILVVSDTPGNIDVPDGATIPAGSWYVTVLGVTTSATTMNLSIVSSAVPAP